MRVFLIDDEEPVRKALGRLLRAEGMEVLSFPSGGEFLKSLDPAARGCIVLDMSMPGFSGLEVQEHLSLLGATLPVIFLTGRSDVPMCAQAMKCGAVDFLVKPVQADNLLAAVRKAFERDARASVNRQEVAQIAARLDRLTPREREVLSEVVEGKLNKQIASGLGAAEKTIKVHRGRVMAKMAASSVAELVRMMEKLRSSGPLV